MGNKVETTIKNNCYKRVARRSVGGFSTLETQVIS